MCKLETDITPTAPNLDALDMQNALVLVQPDALSFPIPVEMSQPVAGKLCSLICAYRLTDILHALEGWESQHQNPAYGRLTWSGLIPDTKVRWMLCYPANV
jgi:hypothetical protein